MIARLLLVGMVLALATSSLFSQGDEPRKDRNLIMQQKLLHAQKLLEGITMANFGLLEKHADEIIVLSKRNEWRVLQTPEYMRFSDELRRNAETIIRHAQKKNLDGAALAYLQMTLNCVECHKYVREVRITWREPTLPGLPADAKLAGR
jgi:hypothetical protein